MRISIFANEIPSTVFIENLVKGLANNGHQIFLYGKYQQSPGYETHPNIQIIKEPKSKIAKLTYAINYFFRLIFTNRKLLFHVFKISKDKLYLRWLKKFNMYITFYCWDLDILHIQWAKSTLWLEALIKDGGINTVLSLRGTQINFSPISNPKLKEHFENIFPYINGFHAVSEAMIEESRKYDIDLPNRSVVAYPAITQSTYDLFSDLYIKQEPFKIISIGRHHSVKGYMYALDALKILVDEGMQVHYTLIAAGSLPEQILFQMEDLNLYNYVSMIDGLPHADVLQAIQKADVLSMPSITEGIPNVILEAMAIGTIVVSTDCSSIPEIIDDGISGYITQGCFPDSIAEGLKKVYNQNTNDRELMKRKAREKIKMNHLMDIQLNNIEKLYQNVLTSSVVMKKTD